MKRILIIITWHILESSSFSSPCPCWGRFFQFFFRTVHGIWARREGKPNWVWYCEAKNGITEWMGKENYSISQLRCEIEISVIWPNLLLQWGSSLSPSNCSRSFHWADWLRPYFLSMRFIHRQRDYTVLHSIPTNCPGSLLLIMAIFFIYFFFAFLRFIMSPLS